ncbi:biotin transporter BioY [Nitratireductor aquimarinus]|uniref:Biotin transporter n=1 Tax=Nitratireductor aquimarinus TaxID=889300 RepID=A0ABU4AN36_9HYPH|nr:MULTISPECIES: biotin transporter BioY [Alphaproteobacteria]MBY6020655.1 biotin transporter BioY [Nitratireductor sp. DP7N14-4]MBN7755869.1 biotin transporter BioY [Nitratireductor aquimarinus]MBN7777603.1 biotin transporter BioY [Nitratireductor pacificus]MBN7781596.1 biotin transporter BioY [Nitratireductor pacificus]MBN7790402.1 biotin transporter BioY [Nitratireductor aquimarinus]
MSLAIASRSLVSQSLPDNAARRLTTQLFLAVGATLLLALSAKTRVVLGPVDLSLQTLAVLLIGATFGMRLGVATLLLYMAEGAMGLPVFQGTPEKGIGLAYMMGPTGGYLLGFVAMAAIAGWAADRGWDRNPLKLAGAMLVAEAALMVLGFAWLAGLIGAENAWQFGVAPFIMPDLIKVALAACFMPAAWALLRGLGISRH